MTKEKVGRKEFDAAIAALQIEVTELEGRIDTLKALSEKADGILNIRLHAMNQFREQMNEERNTFVPLTTFEERLKTLRAELGILNDQAIFNKGKASNHIAYFAVVMSAIAIAVNVVHFFL